LPFGPFDTIQQLSALVEGWIRSDPACILFAVYDKTKASPGAPGDDEGALAGVIGLLDTSTRNLSSEIGFVIILPSFQRTHVTSNAIGLLLRYTLDLPSEGGLGLRRIVWKASPHNLPSIKAAERLGFKRECVARWSFVLPEWKQIGNGLDRRREDPKMNCLGRDSVILSMCWDDWEDGGRTQANTLMERRR
jgi:RimJ/RimL family protein N-acetyltransferase